MPPWITEPKDLERYPRRDRRSLRWRGEYIVVLAAVRVLIHCLLVGTQRSAVIILESR